MRLVDLRRVAVDTAAQFFAVYHLAGIGFADFTQPMCIFNVMTATPANGGMDCSRAFGGLVSCGLDLVLATQRQ